MARGRRAKPKPPQAKSALAPRPVSDRAYGVDMTATAEAVYVELHRLCREAERKGDYANNHCTTFRMIREAVREFIPRNPHERRYALSGELSNIFRIKKGRHRICWIASSKLRRVCVLYISESLRKEGDVNDPYNIFAQMVMSGQFNDVFGQFGIRMPQLRPNPGKKPH